MNTQIKWIITIVAVGIAAAGIIIWIVYFNTSALTTTTDTGAQFGTSVYTRTTVTNNQPLDTLGASNQQNTVPSTQKIFKIANGPIAGATLIQITRPARCQKQSPTPLSLASLKLLGAKRGEAR